MRDRDQDQDEAGRPQKVFVASRLIAENRHLRRELVQAEEPERDREVSEQRVASAMPEPQIVRAREEICEGEGAGELIDHGYSASQMKPYTRHSMPASAGTSRARRRSTCGNSTKSKKSAKLLMLSPTKQMPLHISSRIRRLM